MTDNSSFFSKIDNPDESGWMLICSGKYADCYRVNLRGKWLFAKKLKEEYANDERCVQAFRKEQELGLMIDHPNIVRYQLVADDYSIYQDYVNGLSLDKFIEKNPEYFDNRENRKKFVGELLSAVGYLHSHQIIHLDLKPQNILITTQGNNVKLVDLGMAFHDTFTSTFGGTEGFSAPEVIEGENSKPTFAADIYSIGRLMELVGVRQKGIVKRCVADEPSERYQSVEDVERAFKTSRRNRTILLLTICIAIILGVVLLLMPKMPKQKEEAAPIEQVSPAEEEVKKVEEDSVKELPATPTAPVPKVEEKKQADKDVDSAEIKRRNYFMEMEAKAQKYQADMKEIRSRIDKEEVRIYAPLNKMLANPDYSDNYDQYRSDLRDMLTSCDKELTAAETKIMKEKGYNVSGGGRALLVKYQYKDKIDSTYRAIIKKRHENK